MADKRSEPEQSASVQSVTQCTLVRDWVGAVASEDAEGEESSCGSQARQCANIVLTERLRAARCPEARLLSAVSWTVLQHGILLISEVYVQA